MNTEQITVRIAALKIELEQLIIEANRQIGMKQGAISEVVTVGNGRWGRL